MIDLSDVSVTKLDSSAFFRITTVSTRGDLVAAGGFFGEIACMRISENKDTITESKFLKTTRDPHGICNHVEVDYTRSGSDVLISSNNDTTTKLFDIKSFQPILDLKLDWSCNASRLDPDKMRVCVVGDSTETLLFDVRNGSVTDRLNHHIDYSFACAWSPCGRYLVTGNQDKTAMVYDTRNLKLPVRGISARMAAVRSLQFSSNGQFLLMAESSDFIHIIDVGYNQCGGEQTIDMFGEVTGVCFSPDDETIFIANGDPVYGGILEFERHHSNLGLL